VSIVIFLALRPFFYKQKAELMPEENTTSTVPS